MWLPSGVFAYVLPPKLRRKLGLNRPCDQIIEKPRKTKNPQSVAKDPGNPLISGFEIEVGEKRWNLARYIDYSCWFQIFFIFTPIWGKIPILSNIFQMGLYPPTSNSLAQIHWVFGNRSDVSRNLFCRPLMTSFLSRLNHARRHWFHYLFFLFLWIVFREFVLYVYVWFCFNGIYIFQVYNMYTCWTFICLHRYVKLLLFCLCTVWLMGFFHVFFVDWFLNSRWCYCMLLPEKSSYPKAPWDVMGCQNHLF